MTRTTDPDPGPLPPLGERVPKKPAPAPLEHWEPTGTPGVERERNTGRFRTNIRENGGTPCS